MLKHRVLLIIFLLFAMLTNAQEVRPDVRHAVIITAVKTGKQEIVPFVNVSYEDVKTGKTFLGKTNSDGKAHVKVPIGQTYKIKVNDMLVVTRYFVVNRPYSTMPKSVTYNGPIPTEAGANPVQEDARPDTTSVALDDGVIPDKEKVLIKIAMTDESGSPLADEKVVFTGRKTKRTFIARTNSSGKTKMLLKKGDFYDLHLEKKRDFMVIHLPIDERVYGKTLNLKYKGTKEIAKEELERQEKILQLKARIAELEDQIGQEKANAELQGHYERLRKETIRDFENYFNLKNVSKVYTPIGNAITQGLVEFTMKGNANSTHYHKPAILTLKNKTASTISIIVENGRILNNVEGKFQDLVVTKRQLFVLDPNATETRELEAMCMEKQKSAPTGEATYKFAELVDDNFITLTRFIERKEYQGSIGQRAVWVLTNKEPIKMVAGFKNEQGEQLQNMLRILTKDKKLKSLAQIELGVAQKQLDDIYRDVDERKIEFYSNQFTDKISGFFEYDIKNQSEVMIAMFNTQGIIVREIYYNPSERMGKRRFDFSFDGSVYPAEAYLFKLIIDGSVKKTIKLDKK